MDLVTSLTTLPADQLAERLTTLRADYEDLQALGLKLDLTRGKPGPDQLDLSEGLLNLPTGHKDRAGTDVRNYGGLEGLTELREVFADLLGVDTAQVVAGGNSSLTMMYQVVSWLLSHGAPDAPRPWAQEETVKFVCPVPGYVRHFTMLAELGIEMVTVPMHDDGPDVAAVRALLVTRFRAPRKPIWSTGCVATAIYLVACRREGGRVHGYAAFPKLAVEDAGSIHTAAGLAPSR